MERQERHSKPVLLALRQERFSATTATVTQPIPTVLPAAVAECRTWLLDSLCVRVRQILLHPIRHGYLRTIPRTLREPMETIVRQSITHYLAQTTKPGRSTPADLPE